jgi:uncharacterized repeat protein (TIGR02543 family)
MRGNTGAAILASLLCLFLALGALGGIASASDTVLFSDDFESAFTGWTASARVSWYSGDPRIGTHSVRVPKNSNLQRTVSTVGWQGITASVWLGADLSRSGATFQALWFDGVTWSVVKEFRTGDADADGNLHHFQVPMPPNADNKTAFALRFKLNSKSPHDYGYVDNVMVTAASRCLYTLDLSGSNGSVKVNGVTQALPWFGGFDYGVTVVLEAMADTGYHFTGWSGDLTGSGNPVTILMDGNKGIAADFAVDTYQLSIGSGTGHGSVAVDGIQRALPWVGVFERGATVLLEALPDVGYHFTGWAGALAGTVNPQFITMDGDQAVAVGFASDTYVLHLSGDGGGSVKVNGEDHGLPDSIAVPYSSTVMVEAVPATGWNFTGWSGDLSGTTNPTPLLVDSDKSVTAEFSLNEYALNLSGLGNGIVRVNGTDCTPPWSGAFYHGDVVVLEAVPATGWHFVSWFGDVTGSTSPVYLVMDGTKDVVAGFALNTYTLAITGTNGTVKVNGGPKVLPWSGPCGAGEVVNLEAVPNEGFQFASWSGELVGSENPTTITMDSDHAVSVTFAVDLFSLVVSGTHGSLNVDDVAQTLPYSAFYDYGAVVCLEAVPDAGYRFAGWSGDLTGTTNPADITINSDKAVTASFTIGSYTLSLSGTGGVVKVDDVAQTLPWSGQYYYGTSVTLEAVADSCMRFFGWSGDAEGLDNPAVILMDGDKSIGAEFASLVVFTDVACDFWAAREIAACFFEGTVAGYPDGSYRPALTVTRDQMAVYIARALAGGDAAVPSGPATASFADVPTDHWAFRYVEYARSAGVVQGYWDGYHPSEVVNRAQMAVYVARAIAGGDSGVPDGPPSPYFPDVPETHWAYKYVEFCHDQGVVQGYWDGYHPGETVNRAQMTVYVQRAFTLPM